MSHAAFFPGPVRGAIAVLQLGRLGDTILTTPLLSALRVQFPANEIILIAARDNAAVLEGQPPVDRVIRIPRGYLLLPTLANRLRGERIGLYIDIKDHRSMTSRLVAGMAHARLSIVHPSNAPGSSPWLATPQAAGDGHYVDIALAPMQMLAPDVAFQRRPSLTLPLDSIRRIDPQLAISDMGMILVNISAGDRTRHWGLPKWEATIDLLSQRAAVAVLSAPDERDKAHRVCAMRRTVRPIHSHNILDAAVAVSRARLVVTADTSIVHLASAFDRPCVALFPPEPDNLRRFAPLSNRHIVVMPAGDELLASIEIDSVVAAVDDLLRTSR